MNTIVHTKLAMLMIVSIGALVALGSQRLDADVNSASRSLYEQLQRATTVEQIEAFLDTADPQNARLAIIRLVDLDEAEAIPTLRALWEGRDLPYVTNHPETYQHPIVRLTIAEQLMVLSPGPEYESFIKKAVEHESWVVKSLAADALVIVDDAESIGLLMKIAVSENPLVAKSAVTSLSRIARSGEHATEARQALQKLRADSEKNQEKGRIKIAQASEVSPSLEAVDASTEQDRSLDKELQPYLEKQQYRGALEIVLPEAESGNARAQHLAGELYLAMSPPNYNEAREWLQRAVLQDYAPAKASLANLYLSGRGVEKDVQKAIGLLREAEQQGDRSARLLLERAREKGWWGM